MGGKKIIIISLLVVALLVMVAAVVVLVRGFSGFSGAAQDLLVERERLNRLYAQNPFPSKENIAIENEQSRTVEAWVSQLQEQLSAGRIDVPQLTPSGFIGEFAAVRNRLIAKARSVQPRMTLPAGFDMGFARYATGSLPATTHVPRLALQIRIIETLVETVIESGVQELVRIQRQEFDERQETADVADSDSVDTGSVRRRRPGAPPVRTPGTVSPTRTPSAEAPPKDSQGYPDRPDLFSREQFTMEVSTTELGLLNLLNRLASIPLVVSVSRVEFARDVSQVISPPATADRDYANLHEYPVRLERRVSGPDLERPVRVTLDLDVFIFGSDRVVQDGQ